MNNSEIAFVSKNVVGATFCRNITPKIFVGLVNKISILGSSGKIFIIDLTSHQFEAEIGAEMAPFRKKLLELRNMTIYISWFGISEIAYSYQKFLD